MGKTRHSKIALRIPSNWVGGKERKDYQNNERPKNEPGAIFFRYGVRGVFREDQVIGHQSNSAIKKIYNRILRKRIRRETRRLINETLF